MSNDNVYKAPDAELKVDNSDEDEFFTVSTKKLWIMHVLTLGLYDVYWFYRHWDHLKLKHDLSVSPGIRGVFYILFIYPTLKRIQKAAEAKRLEDASGLMTKVLVWYVMILFQILLSFYYREAFLNNIWLSPALNIVNVVITGFFITSAQSVANRVLDDPEGGKNSRITAANIAWIVFFLLYNFSTILLAMFVGTPDA